MITKISMSKEMIKVSYTHNGRPQMVSDDTKDHAFQKAMDGLLTHLADIKELPSEAMEGRRCNALSISNTPSEEGDNLSGVISATKVTAMGKADNLSTPQCMFEKARKKGKTQVLSADAAEAINNAIDAAITFVKLNRHMRELYSDQEAGKLAA